jgi:hypothetical protein
MDQPLVFTADNAAGDQIQLGLGRGYDNYHVSFDLVTTRLVNSDYAFTVLFDTPQVQNMIFHGALGVRTFNATTTPPSGGGILGAFADNRLIHVEIDVDLKRSLWTIDVDSLPVFTDAFHALDSDVNSIRFDLDNWYSGSAIAPDISVGIDNIHVSSTVVPVPMAVWLFGSGLISLAAAAGVKRKSAASVNRPD